jgi:predicted PurR-regulated permease PerM
MIENKKLESETTEKVPGPGERTGHYDITRITFQVLSIAILIGAAVWILQPFLISIVWAGMIVVTTWPILRYLEDQLGTRRGLAVAVMTLALFLVIFLPLLIVTVLIVQRSEDILDWIKSLTTLTVPPPPSWLNSVPLVGPKLVDLWQPYTDMGIKGLGAYLTPYSMKAASWFFSQAGTVGKLAIQFLLTVFISAILYAKGEAISSGIRAFARRLAGAQGEDVAVLAGKAVRGVALGVVVTAALQAIIGGLGLLVTGVPAALPLTTAMFILSLAQLGPALVLIPVVIWVFWKFGTLWGIIMLVFSIFALSLDNFVRPYLIRKGADMPLVLILFGVIGGLIAFGIIGLFIGPVVLVVGHTLLKAWIWKESAEKAELGENGRKV